MMVVVWLVQTRTEVPRQLHGLGAETSHGGQLVHVPGGLDPVDALGEGGRGQT